MQKNLIYKLLLSYYIILYNISIVLLTTLKFVKRLDIIIKYEILLK